jgi:hypothetical protein
MKTHNAVVDCIRNPVEEPDGRKEVILLSELVQLWIPVEHPSGDELVKDADDERREDGKDDVEEGHRPAFESDLAREVVEPGVIAKVMFL